MYKGPVWFLLWPMAPRPGSGLFCVLAWMDMWHCWVAGARASNMQAVSLYTPLTMWLVVLKGSSVLRWVWPCERPATVRATHRQTSTLLRSDRCGTVWPSHIDCIHDCMCLTTLGVGSSCSCTGSWLLLQWLGLFVYLFMWLFVC